MGERQSAEAEARFAQTSAALEKVDLPVPVLSRFEEARFYGALKSLTFTPGGGATIVITVHTGLDEVVKLKDAWRVPLVIGMWRQ